MAKFRIFITLFMIQWIAYGIIVINYRAISQANIATALISEFFWGSLNYFVIKKISKNESDIVGWAGYTTGCMAGCYTGILISKHLLGV